MQRGLQSLSWNVGRVWPQTHHRHPNFRIRFCRDGHRCRHAWTASDLRVHELVVQSGCGRPNSEQCTENAVHVRRTIRVPIVFRGNDGAGGQLGSTHSLVCGGLYSNVPGLKMVIPSNPYEAKGLLKTAIRDDDPVFFLESERMLGDKGEVPEEEYLIPFPFEGNVVRQGTDCTLLSWGRPVNFAMDAAEELAKEGLSCEVIDGRTIRPLDLETIVRSVKKTNRLVVIDQSWSFGSPGSEVASQVHASCFDDLDNHVHRVHSMMSPPVRGNLEQEMLPNARHASAKRFAAAATLPDPQREEGIQLLSIEVTMPRLSDTMESGTISLSGKLPLATKSPPEMLSLMLRPTRPPWNLPCMTMAIASGDVEHNGQQLMLVR